MKQLMGLVLIGAGTWMVWKLLLKDAEPKIEPLKPLPPGAKLTGKVQQTTDTMPPGHEGEVIGYARRNWGEVRLANGMNDWVEIA